MRMSFGTSIILNMFCFLFFLILPYQFYILNYRETKEETQQLSYNKEDPHNQVKKHHNNKLLSNRNLMLIDCITIISLQQNIIKNIKKRKTDSIIHATMPIEYVRRKFIPTLFCPVRYKIFTNQNHFKLPYYLIDCIHKICSILLCVLLLRFEKK